MEDKTERDSLDEYISGIKLKKELIESLFLVAEGMGISINNPTDLVRFVLNSWIADHPINN